MNVFFSVPLLFLVAIFEVGLQPHLTMLNATPDFMLLTVSLWSLMQGPTEGALWALAGSFFLALFSGGPPLVLIIALVPVALVSSAGRSIVYGERLILPLSVVFVASLLYGLEIFFLLKLTGWHGNLSLTFEHRMLPNAVYNALMALVLYPIFRQVHSAVSRERLEL